jgi:hypothetical protein
MSYFVCVRAGHNTHNETSLNGWNVASRAHLTEYMELEYLLEQDMVVLLQKTISLEGRLNRRTLEKEYTVLLCHTLAMDRVRQCQKTKHRTLVKNTV